MKSLRKIVLLGFLIPVLALLLSVAALAYDDSTVNVQLGGKLISFTDVSPCVQNGRVFVPIRALFEAMGAQVDYNADLNTVTAVRGETTVTLTIGQKNVKITVNGSTRTVETDAASYVENCRVMIPVRFATEAFGCSVGWDSNEKTVLILDKQALLSANDAKYTLMDEYLKFSQKFKQSSYAINGTFDFSLQTTVTGEVIPVVVNGTITGVCDTSAADLEIDLVINLDDLIASSGQELDEATQLILPSLQNLNVEYILNLSDGILYIRSPLLSLAMGINAESWISINLSNVDYAALLSASKTEDFEDYVDLCLELIPISDTGTLTTTAEFLTMINSCLNDSAFVKNGDTYSNTISYQDDELTVQGTIVFVIKDDEMTSFGVSLDFDSSEMSLYTVGSLDSDGNLVLTMTMNVPEDMELSLEYTIKYTKTDALPRCAPPEESTIIPMDSLGG